MHRLAVAVIGEQSGASGTLPDLVSQAVNARLVFSSTEMPSRQNDAAVRQLAELEPEVVLVAVDAADPDPGLAAIRLLRSSLSGLVICAVGDLQQPHTVIHAIREGAIDFIDRNSQRSAVEAALANLAAEVLRSSRKQGKVITFIGCNGGSGATTLAVNTALALQELTGRVALIDLAAYSHAALHFNVQPSFGVSDALANLDRMDKRLMEGYMLPCIGGLHLMSGVTYPMATALNPNELVSLFDLLATRYDYIVADCSGRVDPASREVCYASAAVFLVFQSSLASMFTARRLRDYLVWEIGAERVHLLLNRCRRGGLSDTELRDAVNGEVQWKIPDGSDAVNESIERGTPIILQKKNDVGRAIRQLAGTLVHSDGPRRVEERTHELVPST